MSDTNTTPAPTPERSPLHKVVFACCKCEHVFTEPDGRQHQDGDIDQWCPNCGAKEDYWAEYYELGYSPDLTALRAAADEMEAAILSVRDSKMGDNPEPLIERCEQALTRYADLKKETRK